MEEALSKYAELSTGEARELAEAALAQCEEDLAALEAEPTGGSDTHELAMAKARWEQFKAEKTKRKRAASRIEELEQLILPYQLELDVLRAEKEMHDKRAAKLEHLRAIIPLEKQFIAECEESDEEEEEE